MKFFKKKEKKSVKKKYYYFVSYRYESNRKCGFDNTEFKGDFRVEGINDIHYMQDMIAQQLPVKFKLSQKFIVSILFYKITRIDIINSPEGINGEKKN